MAWFGKKEESGKIELPSLPELPKLPELPSLDEFSSESKINLPALPSYPNSSFGKKFSQNAIKDAVSGEKEEEEEFNADESLEEETMRKPLSRNANLQNSPIPGFVKRATLSSEEYKPKFSGLRRNEKMEPVFIRVDKFEESLNILDDARGKIAEMEEMLRHIKKIKEEEDTELKEWEIEIQKIKSDFDKIDKELFSKI